MLYFKPIGVFLDANEEVFFVIWSTIFMRCIKVRINKVEDFLYRFAPESFWLYSSSEYCGMNTSKACKAIKESCYKLGVISQERIDWLNVGLYGDFYPLSIKHKYLLTEMNFLLKEYLLPSGEFAPFAIIKGQSLEFAQENFDLKINNSLIPISFIETNKKFFGFVDF